MKKYDIVIGKQFGIINGEKNIIFIKTGRGGTTRLPSKYYEISDVLNFE